jgi:hypothetical protein
MRILVSGSHGLIGTALAARMRMRGDAVILLVRQPSSASDEAILWQPDAGAVDRAHIEGLDAVVHLAGESIAGLWTKGRRERIRESRIRGTRLLCESLAQCARPPRVILCASGIGYYGSRGDALLDENEPPGTDFLASVCVNWEAATRPASSRGIRVVLMRTAVVLSPEGGILPRMLGPFRLGLGAEIGNGSQYLSWIALDDLIHAYLFAIADERLEGPANATSPQPVTNREFTRSLARVLGRRAPFRVPAWILRRVLGSMADSLLLASQRAVPARLEQAGFRFSDPDLNGALEKVLR